MKKFSVSLVYIKDCLIDNENVRQTALFVLIVDNTNEFDAQDKAINHFSDKSNGMQLLIKTTVEIK